MPKDIRVVFNSDGIERRSNMTSCYIRLSEIAAIVEFDSSWTSRITLKNGLSYIVDGSDDILSDVKQGQNDLAKNGEATNPVLDDLHHFWLVKEERQPQSWLGRLFADAAHLVKGDGEPLPPLRVTHAQNGDKLTRAQLREIYRPDGSLIEPENTGPTP